MKKIVIDNVENFIQSEYDISDTFTRIKEHFFKILTNIFS